jgi:rhodanese-related sulfurtransferase
MMNHVPRPNHWRTNAVTLLALLSMMVPACRKSDKPADTRPSVEKAQASQKEKTGAEAQSATKAPIGEDAQAGASVEKALRHIPPGEARALIDGEEEWVYLDVRSQREFKEGHPAGAWNIPILYRASPDGPMTPNPDFLAQVQKTFPKDARIVCGCRTGRRSARAAQLLIDAGYESVVNMAGGYVGRKEADGSNAIKGWKDSGFPCAQGDGGEKSFARIKE